MAFTPQLAPVLKGAVAPQGAGAILPADAIDKAVSSLTSIVEYFRAKNIADPTKAFKSRAGNILTPGGAPAAAAALVANDAAFGGITSLDISGMTAAANVLVSSALCPASFTIIETLRATTLKNPQAFFGVNVSGFYVTISGTGTVNVQAAQTGDTAWADNNVVLPAAITSLIWISHDAATKTTRVGKSTGIVSSHVHSVANTPGATSTARPFSYYASAAGTNLNGKVEGALLLNKAYAADGSAEDNNIAALINAWRTAIGAAN